MLVCCKEEGRNALTEELDSFTCFMEQMMRDSSLANYKPYLITSIIETFYEFGCKLLDGKASCKDTQSIRLDRLLKDNKINQIQYEIFNTTRKVRNSLLHDLTYFPSSDEIVGFHKVFSPFSDTVNTGSHQTREEAVLSYNKAIVNGYCIISNQLSDEFYRAAMGLE